MLDSVDPFHNTHQPMSETLRQLEQPISKILGEFIQRCAPDHNTRTVAITSLVMSYWQLKGRALTPDVPSMLLVQTVQTGETIDDPVDEFMKGLVYIQEQNKPRVQSEGPFACGSIDLAPKAMGNAIQERRLLGNDFVDNPAKLQSARELEQRFRAAQVTGFGHGKCRPYSRAWHPDYGLLTDGNGQIILRLNEAPDRVAFRRDLLDDPKRLLFPSGIGNNLELTPKNLSVSGSLPQNLCDGKLAASTFAMGLPFFLLPHTTAEPLKPDCAAAISNLATIWQNEPVAPVLPILRLPLSPSALPLQSALRKRLANLPATYEFAVLQAVHQLDGICDRIARFAMGNETKAEELVALYISLYENTLRGIVLSVVSLSYFGHGLYPDSECKNMRVKAHKLLRKLREKGPTNCGELLKILHLSKEERDPLLERLREENLVRVEKGNATATNFTEFTKGLYSREEFQLVKS